MSFYSIFSISVGTTLALLGGGFLAFPQFTRDFLQPRVDSLKMPAWKILGVIIGVIGLFVIFSMDYLKIAWIVLLIGAAIFSQGIFYLFDRDSKLAVNWFLKNWPDRNFRLAGLTILICGLLLIYAGI